MALGDPPETLSEEQKKDLVHKYLEVRTFSLLGYKMASRKEHRSVTERQWMHANLVILATPVRVLGLQVVSLGHLGGFVAF